MTIPSAPREAENPTGAQPSWIKRLLFSEYFVLYLSLLYFAALLPFVPGLASGGNLSNILGNVWPLLAVAIGQTVVLIVAGIDLSQSSVMALTSTVGAMFITRQLDPALFGKSPLWGSVLHEGGGPLGHSTFAPLLGCLIMLGLGALIGFLNGLAITRLVMPAFMVTLVSQTLFSAVAIFLTKSENIIHLPPAFNALGQGGAGVFTWALLITGLLGLGAHLVLSRSLLGRRLYAVGANVRAARVSGVPVSATIVAAYVFSGVCAATAAILYTGRLETGRPTLGSDMLLDIIGAAVIGGTSLFGGKGKVLWTVFGVLFFVLLDNSLNLLSLPFYTIMVVKGGFILLAAALDVYRVRSLGARA